MKQSVYKKNGNGHAFKSIVDGESRIYRSDRRLNLKNEFCRTNMRNREGKRSFLVKGQVLSGTHYSSYLRCTNCNLLKERKEFWNYTVQESIRHNNGCNIRCRSCQPKKYTYCLGYHVDDFVVEDYDEHSSECSEESDDSDNDLIELEDSDEESDEKFEEDSDDELEEDSDDEDEKSEKCSEEHLEDLYLMDLEECSMDLEENSENDSMDVENIFEVENIYEKRYDWDTNKRMYHVKWLGYDESENTWEPHEEVSHLLDEFVPKAVL